MVKNTIRGRPKIPKENDLIDRLEKKIEDETKLKKRLLRMVNRITSNKGKPIKESTIKFIKYPSEMFFNYEKYGLDKNDALINRLRNQCTKPPTIGYLSLTEMEAICGKLPQGTEIEEKINKGLECISASYIDYSKAYSNRIIENYTQFDMNSAYGYQLISNKLPHTLKDIKQGLHPVSKDEIAVYEGYEGEFSFNRWDFLNIRNTYIYSTFEYGKEFILKYYELRKQEKYKKFAKDLLLCSIGAIHKYRKNLIARYVWYKQRQLMKDIVYEIEDNGGKVLKAHTDSIGFINAKEFPAKIGYGIGEWKLEHENKRVYIIYAGGYQIEGKRPTLSGISWGGNFIEEKNGRRTHWTTFPAIKEGMTIKSYEKDGIEFKTIGEYTIFTKGCE